MLQRDTDKKLNNHTYDANVTLSPRLGVFSAANVLTVLALFISLYNKSFAFAGYSVRPNHVRDFLRSAGKNGARNEEAAAKYGGESRFAEALIQGVAHAGVSYGVDTHHVVAGDVKATPVKLSNRNGVVPPAKVELWKPSPLPAAALPAISGQVVHVTRQDRSAVAQVLRPFTGGCMRNAFESEAVYGGSSTTAVRNNKARVVGHTIDVAVRSYTVPSFTVVARGLAGENPVQLQLLNEEHPGVSKILNMPDVLRCCDAALDCQCCKYEAVTGAPTRNNLRVHRQYQCASVSARTRSALRRSAVRAPSPRLRRRRGGAGVQRSPVRPARLDGGCARLRRPGAVADSARHLDRLAAVGRSRCVRQVQPGRARRVGGVRARAAARAGQRRRGGRHGRVGGRIHDGSRKRAHARAVHDERQGGAHP